MEPEKNTERLVRKWIARAFRFAAYVLAGILGSGVVFVLADGCPVRHPTFCDWQFEGNRAVSQRLMIQRGELECDVAGLAIWIGVLAVLGIFFGLLENRIGQGQWSVDASQRMPLYLWWACGFPIIVAGVCTAVVFLL